MGFSLVDWGLPHCDVEGNALTVFSVHAPNCSSDYLNFQDWLIQGLKGTGRLEGQSVWESLSQTAGKGNPDNCQNSAERGTMWTNG